MHVFCDRDQCLEVFCSRLALVGCEPTQPLQPQALSLLASFHNMRLGYRVVLLKISPINDSIVKLTDIVFPGGLPGLIKLKQFRNQLSATPDASAAAELFGDKLEAKPVKIDVGDIDVGDIENLCVLLDESSILAVFEYIRSEGINFDRHQRKAMQEATTSELSKLDMALSFRQGLVAMCQFCCFPTSKAQSTWVGLNHQPHGLLLSKELRDVGIIEPVSQYCNDYMHGTWSNGTLNVAIFALFTSLSAAGLKVWSLVADWVALWVLPDRHMRQRLLEAEAGHGSSSSSSCMCPTIPCCTCGQGNPSACRVGCRGPGCRHSVCTACAYKDDSGNLDLFYCVHCFEPERQRRIGWTNIGSSC